MSMCCIRLNKNNLSIFELLIAGLMDERGNKNNRCRELTEKRKKKKKGILLKMNALKLPKLGTKIMFSDQDFI